MCSLGVNGEGEARGQLANSGSPGKMVVKQNVDCGCMYCMKKLLNRHMLDRQQFCHSM